MRAFNSFHHIALGHGAELRLRLSSLAKENHDKRITTLKKLFLLLSLATCLIGAAHAQILAPMFAPEPSSGSLVCSGSPCPTNNPTGTTLNLTSVGTTDWYSPGATGATCPGTERDSSGGSLIGAYTLGGGATASGLTVGYFTRTWSNGTPDASHGDSSGLGGGCGILSTTGYSISTTCPASLASHTCLVYLMAFGGGHWTLTAHLSDSSAPDFVDPEAPGNSAMAYTFVYNAASNGQTLTVTVVQNSSPQPVYLQGVAYQ